MRALRKLKLASIVNINIETLFFYKDIGNHCFPRFLISTVSVLYQLRSGAVALDA
jgi:hypothetical protein